MSYPPDASRSCHEADGRSDRSGGSGGATSSSGGGVYGTFCSNLGGKWSIPVSTASTATISRELMINPSHHVSSHDRLVSNWKRWSLGLDYLLQDSEGVALFKTYLHYEGCSNLLDFWFACQGFRSKVDPADHRKITQLIKVIYRTYIRGSGTGTIGMTNVSLPGQLTESQSNPNVLQSRTEPIRLRAETKRMISERISRKHSLDQSVFDPAQTEVEHFLRTTAYPAFLKSDVYIDFLQSAIDGSTYKFAPNQDTSDRAVAVGWPTSTCSNNNAGFPGGIVSHPPGGKFLPTLEEDRELRSDDLPCYSIQSGHTQTVQTPGACPVPHQQPQLHCLHCSQYHSQGHSICPPADRSNPWLSQLPHPIPPGLRSLGPATNQPNLFAPMTTTATTAVGATSTAPLNAEVPQLTRFYRAELSTQQQAFITQTGGSSNVMRMTHQPVDFFSRRPYPHVPCDLTAGSSRPLAPYAHTHWTDALCPPSVPLGDLCGSRLPTQPPNPYHISYAPVSARDSERHSLSSEARTDDTHSHTDSSHDGTTTRLWKCSFGHRYTGQMPKPPITQTHSPADFPSTTAVTVHHTSRHPSTTTATVVQCGVLGPGSSSALLSPKLGEDGGHIQTNRIAAHRSTATEPFHQPELTDSSKSHGRHARRAVRRSGNAGGWRSGDRSGRGGTVTGPGDLLIGVNATGASVPSKSVTRSHNLAERDPQAFFRILSDKLQRVLDNQTATERLDQLMIESSPNADQSAGEPVHPDRSESTHRSRTESHHLTQTDPVATSVVDSGKTVDMTTSATVTVAMSTTTENTRSHTTVTATALLRRPWADRLLAAARSQQDSTRDNAQAILEDHCSRIWAASADRTPNSSSSSGGGGGSGVGGVVGVVTENTGDGLSADQNSDSFTHLTHRTTHTDIGTFDTALQTTNPLHMVCNSSRLTENTVIGRGTSRTQDSDLVLSPVRLEPFGLPVTCAIVTPVTKSDVSSLEVIRSDPVIEARPNGDKVDTQSKSSTSSDSQCGSGSSPSSTDLGCGRVSEAAELNALLNLSFPLGASTSGPGQSSGSPSALHQPSGETGLHTPARPIPVETAGVTAPTTAPIVTRTTVCTTQHSTSSSITSAISTSTPGLPASSPSSNSSPNTLVIGYYLGDDPVPYRSLWPSSEITLGQFKQLIPKKKGSFRYFFKKFSNEFGSGVVHQEITNDNCVLPLWEGKVVAKVERIE